MSRVAISPPARALLILLCAGAILAAYSNHFFNLFHFDDNFAIVGNPWIRSLSNILRFFTDARTFSVLPSNQTYRPVVSASLAVDVWLANGLDNVWVFHLSTFLWYSIELAVMGLLFEHVIRWGRPGADSFLTSLFAVCLYGLHPAMSDTVNYIIQRAEVFSTLGVAGTLVLYARLPGWRKSGVYLIPAALGMLAKTPAVMFAPLLLVYVLLFETDVPSEQSRPWPVRLLDAGYRCAPDFLVAFGLLWFTDGMTSSSFQQGATNAYDYFITQPRVAFHYVAQFLMPLHLSVDSGRQPYTSLLAPGALAGFAFVLLVAGLIVVTARRPAWRPCCFGLCWFLLALAPTALFPLAEVENDHRMFFPFVGLALAAAYALREAVSALPVPPKVRWIGAILILTACAAGTWHRNRVWRTDESLWLDAVQKSPASSRGQMNYALVLRKKGDLAGALEYLERADKLTPQAPLVKLNLGLVLGDLDRNGEAEQQFQEAIDLDPADWRLWRYYSEWLAGQGRIAEATAALETAVQRNPADLSARHALMRVYEAAGDSGGLKSFAEATLRMFPEDADARLALAQSPK